MQRSGSARAESAARGRKDPSAAAAAQRTALARAMLERFEGYAKDVEGFTQEERGDVLGRYRAELKRALERAMRLLEAMRRLNSFSAGDLPKTSSPERRRKGGGRL